MSPRVLQVLALQVLTASALAAEYPRVRGIAAEGVVIPATAAKQQAMFFPGAGAFFTPTDADIQQLEARLPRFLVTEALRDRDFREHITEIRHRLQTYRRQYVGLLSAGRKTILLNAFPKDESFSWRDGFIEVSDGGTSYWRVTYDLRQQKFHRLGINGVAWRGNPSNQAMQRTAGRAAFPLPMSSTLHPQPSAPSPAVADLVSR